jgi:TRAP-type C4-dicarboxylate transport system permease small subunit
MLVVIVFFSVAQVAVLKSHVSVSLVFSYFPIRLQAVLNLLTSLMCLGISLSMALQLAKRVWVNVSYTSPYSQSLGIPLKPVYLGASLGLFLLSLVFLMDFIRYLTDVSNPNTDR